MQMSLQRDVEGALGPWHINTNHTRVQHIQQSQNPCYRCLRSDVSKSKSTWQAWHVREGLIKVSCGRGPLALPIDQH